MNLKADDREMALVEALQKLVNSTLMLLSYSNPHKLPSDHERQYIAVHGVIDEAKVALAAHDTPSDEPPDIHPDDIHPDDIGAGDRQAGDNTPGY